MSIMPDPLTGVMNVEGARPSPVHPWDQQSVRGHVVRPSLFLGPVLHHCARTSLASQWTWWQSP